MYFQFIFVVILVQSEAASLGHDLETYQKRADSFGFNAIVVDGHDIEALIKAFETASFTKDKPTALICKTFKGKYIIYINY